MRGGVRHGRVRTFVVGVRMLSRSQAHLPAKYGLGSAHFTGYTALPMQRLALSHRYFQWGSAYWKILVDWSAKWLELNDDEFDGQVFSMAVALRCGALLPCGSQSSYKNIWCIVQAYVRECMDKHRSANALSIVSFVEWAVNCR